MYCSDANQSDCLGRMINHSKKHPNVRPKLLEQENQTPKLIFKAMRDIAANEEILYDYGDRDQASILAFPWLKE